MKRKVPFVWEESSRKQTKYEATRTKFVRALSRLSSEQQEKLLKMAPTHILREGASIKFGWEKGDESATKRTRVYWQGDWNPGESLPPNQSFPSLASSYRTHPRTNAAKVSHPRIDVSGRFPDAGGKMAYFFEPEAPPKPTFPLPVGKLTQKNRMQFDASYRSLIDSKMKMGDYSRPPRTQNLSMSHTDTLAPIPTPQPASLHYEPADPLYDPGDRVPSHFGSADPSQSLPPNLYVAHQVNLQHPLPYLPPDIQRKIYAQYLQDPNPPRSAPEHNVPSLDEEDRSLRQMGSMADSVTQRPRGVRETHTTDALTVLPTPPSNEVTESNEAEDDPTGVQELISFFEGLEGGEEHSVTETTEELATTLANMVTDPTPEQWHIMMVLRGEPPHTNEGPWTADRLTHHLHAHHEWTPAVPPNLYVANQVNLQHPLPYLPPDIQRKIYAQYLQDPNPPRSAPEHNVPSLDDEGRSFFFGSMSVPGTLQYPQGRETQSSESTVFQPTPHPSLLANPLESTAFQPTPNPSLLANPLESTTPSAEPTSPAEAPAQHHTAQHSTAQHTNRQSHSGPIDAEDPVEYSTEGPSADMPSHYRTKKPRPRKRGQQMSRYSPFPVLV